MAHAVTQTKSEVQVRHVFMAGFDWLFEIKEQFSKGSFGRVFVAISIVEWKMVTIKKLRGFKENLSSKIRSSKYSKR